MEKNTTSRKHRLDILLSVASVTLAVLACSAPGTTPSASPTPYVPPDTPAATAESPTAGPPTAEPPTAAPPTAAPTGGVIYSAGTWGSQRTYSLAAGGSSTDLGYTVAGWSSLSPAGRWLAYRGELPPTTAINVVNLQTGVAYSIPATSGFDIFGIGFDQAETRMAFLELGPMSESGTPWAIVVVNLADGSTARFEATMLYADGTGFAPLPGNPIGWSGSGADLLIDTFVPYSEGNWAGIKALTLPPGAASAPVDLLSPRDVLLMGDYLSGEKLSPDGFSLLYMNRDRSYMPSGYEVIAYDLAVNQLETINVTGGAPTLLVNVTDGSALAWTAAWSPDGAQILFAQGNYAGPSFGSLTLKVRDGAGTIRDVGPAPLPAGGNLSDLGWCMPNTALAAFSTSDGDYQLYTVDLTTGASALVTTDQSVSVLGCVR